MAHKMAILQEYFENAYICCVHYLVNKKLHWTERIFWLTAILASLGGTYYVVSRTWFEYRGQKPMYKVDTDYLDWTTPYPSVVVCEKKSDAITTKQKRAVDKYLDRIKYNKSLVSDDFKMRIQQFAFFSSSYTGSLNSICKANECPKGNYSILSEELRSACIDIFTFCKYNGEPFDCCTEFLLVNTTYGKCFGFNNYGGRDENGRRVHILKRHFLREPSRTQGMLYFELKKIELAIYVVHPLEVPHHQNQNAFYQNQLTTDNEYYYRLNAEVETFLGPPGIPDADKFQETVTFDEERSVPIEERSCRFSDENNLKYFDFYSYSNCIMECAMVDQMQRCGCILHNFPVDPSVHCNFDSLSCAVKIPINADCGCLSDCNNTVLHKVGTYDRRKRASFMDAATKLSFTLDIPAPTMRYIRYSLKSPLSFIVSIGGVIGFFLGISYQSITQAFYYLFVRSVTDYLTLRKKRKAKEKEGKTNENFRIARMKLKLKEVERQIRRGMAEKME